MLLVRCYNWHSKGEFCPEHKHWRFYWDVTYGMLYWKNVESSDCTHDADPVVVSTQMQ